MFFDGVVKSITSSAAAANSVPCSSQFSTYMYPLGELFLTKSNMPTNPCPNMPQETKSNSCHQCHNKKADLFVCTSKSAYGKVHKITCADSLGKPLHVKILKHNSPEMHQEILQKLSFPKIPSRVSTSSLEPLYYLVAFLDMSMLPKHLYMLEMQEKEGKTGIFYAKQQKIFLHLSFVYTSYSINQPRLRGPHRLSHHNPNDKPELNSTPVLASEMKVGKNHQPEHVQPSKDSKRVGMEVSTSDDKEKEIKNTITDDNQVSEEAAVR